MPYKKKEEYRKYQREYNKDYYQRTPRQQEIMKIYSRLSKIKKTVEELRSMIIIKKVKKYGNIHSCLVLLPVSWTGKEVLVIDTKLFEKDIRKSRV